MAQMYLYNGVKLPEPPSGFSGNMLILYDVETGQYVLCYGTFYAYPLDPKPIVYPSASQLTCYGFNEATGQWVEIPIIPEDGEAYWTLVCSPDEYVWTNTDIYWLDSQTASEPTAEVAYEGTEAVAVIPDEETPDEETRDPQSLTAGWLVGKKIAAMRR